MNWDSPEDRLRLIENVGVNEYNRQANLHHQRATIATVNGYDIRPVHCRFGRIFMVHVSGATKGYYKFEDAKAYANSLPKRKRHRPPAT
jgi:hypothetical protein